MNYHADADIHAILGDGGVPMTQQMRATSLIHFGDVACVNKDLEAGRAYLGYGEDLALVAIDETVQASALSYGFEPSLEDLTRRFEQSLKQARTLGTEIIDRFGGRRFVRDGLCAMTWSS